MIEIVRINVTPSWLGLLLIGDANIPDRTLKRLSRSVGKVEPFPHQPVIQSLRLN